MNPTNEQELRELAHIIMNADTPYDAIQFVKDHTNAEITKVLNRLDLNKETLYWWTGGDYVRTTAVDMRAIAAEQAKLKERDDE